MMGNRYQIILIDREQRRQGIKKLASAFRVLMQDENDAILKIDRETKEDGVYYTATIESRQGV